MRLGNERNPRQSYGPWENPNKITGRKDRRMVSLRPEGRSIDVQKLTLTIPKHRNTHGRSSCRGIGVALVGTGNPLRFFLPTCQRWSTQECGRVRWHGEWKGKMQEGKVKCEGRYGSREQESRIEGHGWKRGGAGGRTERTGSTAERSGPELYCTMPPVLCHGPGGKGDGGGGGGEGWSLLQQDGRRTSWRCMITVTVIYETEVV